MQPVIVTASANPVTIDFISAPPNGSALSCERR
jgi:hypothetical protein